MSTVEGRGLSHSGRYKGHDAPCAGFTDAECVIADTQRQNSNDPLEKCIMTELGEADRLGGVTLSHSDVWQS